MSLFGFSRRATAALSQQSVPRRPASISGQRPFWSRMRRFPQGEPPHSRWRVVMRVLLRGLTARLLATGARAQAPGTYLVYFDLDRSALTGEGRQVVQEAANEYRRTGTARVSLNGHADLSGSSDYNQALSQRRAETVRRELVRLGVPAGRSRPSPRARPTRPCRRRTAPRGPEPPGRDHDPAAGRGAGPGACPRRRRARRPMSRRPRRSLRTGTASSSPSPRSTATTSWRTTRTTPRTTWPGSSSPSTPCRASWAASR
jgi:outer membrane protein OmpA-like peptidoglycan-associated protein